MNDPVTVHENSNPSMPRPYETPTVKPIGNLNDLLLGHTGPNCDQQHATGAAVDDGTCGG